ncbi:MAG: phosphoribosylamine--glycine ligase, partial [Bacteroidales bacterium]|nr:phosphoribosylamine--glycine ligase [Bacteroidales bacterium]
GPEFSFLCFVDGCNVYPMPLSQDHKRAFDGDRGPNTGGMGAYTGLPFITDEDREFALESIMKPAAAAMCTEGCPLSGVLYGGLMKTPQGVKVIEFNARFGDPETEVVLPLLESDIYDVFEGVALGRKVAEPVWNDGVTLGVVLASEGYPGKYEKGFEIGGLEQVDAKIYHMGTAFKDGKLVTNGGRVLMVVSGGLDVADARERVYREVAKVRCDNLFHRTDIAHCAFE